MPAVLSQEIILSVCECCMEPLSESAVGSHFDPAYETVDKIGLVIQNYRINSNNFFKHTLHSLNPFLSYIQSECGIKMGESHC